MLCQPRPDRPPTPPFEAASADSDRKPSNEIIESQRLKAYGQMPRRNLQTLWEGVQLLRARIWGWNTVNSTRPSIAAPIGT